MNTNHLNLHAAIMQQTAGLHQQLQQSVNTARIYNWSMRVQRDPVPDMIQNSNGMTNEDWFAFCDQIDHVLQPARHIKGAQAIALVTCIGGTLTLLLCFAMGVGIASHFVEVFPAFFVTTMVLSVGFSCASYGRINAAKPLLRNLCEEATQKQDDLTLAYGEYVTTSRNSDGKSSTSTFTYYISISKKVAGAGTLQALNSASPFGPGLQAANLAAMMGIMNDANAQLQAPQNGVTSATAQPEVPIATATAIPIPENGCNDIEAGKHTVMTDVDARACSPSRYSSQPFRPPPANAPHPPINAHPPSLSAPPAELKQAGQMPLKQSSEPSSVSTCCTTDKMTKTQPQSSSTSASSPSSPLCLQPSAPPAPTTGTTTADTTMTNPAAASNKPNAIFSPVEYREWTGTLFVYQNRILFRGTSNSFVDNDDDEENEQQQQNPKQVKIFLHQIHKHQISSAKQSRHLLRLSNSAKQSKVFEFPDRESLVQSQQIIRKLKQNGTLASKE
jgi:hypothetical protein